MKKWAKIAIVIFIALTSPWWLTAGCLGVSMIYGEIDEYIYSPTADFDSERWKEGVSKYRYSVLEAVAEGIIEKGISKDNVFGLLGRPDHIDNEGNWQYESIQPGWRLIDFSGGGVLVEYDNDGKVSRSSVSIWID